MVKFETKVEKVTAKEEVFYCDVCGAQISRDKYKCCMCSKDLCGKCIGHIDDSWYTGDHPEYYCKECWGKGEYYRTEIEKLENSIEELSLEWRRQCNNN